jgi:hypothetical protein
MASHAFGVMRGLDPRIHDEFRAKNSCRRYSRRVIMDCRVKPGNDAQCASIPTRNFLG